MAEDGGERAPTSLSRHRHALLRRRRAVGEDEEHLLRGVRDQVLAGAVPDLHLGRRVAVAREPRPVHREHPLRDRDGAAPARAGEPLIAEERQREAVDAGAEDVDPPNAACTAIALFIAESVTMSGIRIP